MLSSPRASRPGSGRTRSLRELEAQEGAGPSEEEDEDDEDMNQGLSEGAGNAFKGDSQDTETARRADVRARNRIASVEHRKKRKVGPGTAVSGTWVRLQLAVGGAGLTEPAHLSMLTLCIVKT